MDFEQHKSIIWAYGLMILSIILMICAILQQFTTIAWIATIYLVIFLAYMFRMELKLKSEKIELYEQFAGVRCLESRTVIDENLVEESLFYIRDTVSIADIDISEYKSNIESTAKKASKAKERDLNSAINDISDWKIIKCQLIQPDILSKYEVQEFVEFYIITPTDDLSGFHEIPNSTLIFNGKTIVGTKLFGDLLFITWILPDKPLFILYNSPKLVLPLTNVRKELEGVIQVSIKILTQEVLDYKEKQKNFDHLVQEKLKQIELLSKKADLANARSEYIQTEALERPDPEIDPTIVSVNRGLLIFLGIGFIVFAVLYLATIFGRLGL